MNLDGIHPEVRRAIEAIELPEVLEMLQRLAKYGLGISVPHMHGKDCEFLPLPIGKVALEDGLQVSFEDADDPDAQSAVPVGWRCGWDDEKAAPMAKCVWTSCAIFHHHKKRLVN